MKKYKHLIITSLFTLLPCLIGLALWKDLPDRMPTHFGPGGVDGWSSKGFAVFGLPLMILGFHIILWFATLLDKNNQQPGNRKVLDLILYIFPALSIVMSGVVYGTALGEIPDITGVMAVLMGILFVVIGNYLPKCRQNATLGIKLKWTYHNEENWNKTHRVGGITWVICGILMIVFGILGFVEGLLVVVFPMILIPVVYSWRLYKKQIASGTVKATDQPKIEFPGWARWLTWVMVAVLAVILAVILYVVLFTGNIEAVVADGYLNISASYWDDSVVDLDTVESVEYVAQGVDGTRNWGYGSPRLFLGSFVNDSLGTYIRYTYEDCRECILIRAGGEYLVLNAKTPEETRALYERILTEWGK